MNEQVHMQGGAIEADKAQVKQVLDIVAEQFVMIETTVTSRVPDTICCYTETWKGGVALGARMVGEKVIVDFGPGKVPSPRFPEIKEHILAELHRTFGGRFQLANESEFIPYYSTLPLSDAGKAFNARRFAALQQSENSSGKMA